MEHFSPREKDIIKIIGKKKLTLVEISDELFKGETKPLDPTITVNNSVRRIIKKCAYHELGWVLKIAKVNGKSLIRRVSLSKS